jgi:carbon-monoxide dehydrogenase medium subunit
MQEINMWKQYNNLTNEKELLELLDKDGSKTRIIAGGTDLMLELERGLRPEIENLADISRIPGLDKILEDEKGLIHIGPMVTHNDILASQLIRLKAFPLFQACWQVGSPQIRNRGTVAGNLVTGSPANDTISPLMALDASLILKSKKGERTVQLVDFYKGVRKTVLQPDEFVKEIIFKGLNENQNGYFVKSALRRAQAISVVNACVILEIKENIIQRARITLGSVAPTIVHARSAEEYLEGKVLSDVVILQAAEMAGNAARPISDVRGSDQYRSYVVQVLVKKALTAILTGGYRSTVPENIVRLDSSSNQIRMAMQPWDGKEINTRINGKSFTFKHGLNQSLLHLMREEAGLSGTKEGCGEGECGACTVHLDGKAVMSCLVPAPRADQAEIITIEGIQKGDQLHPVQQAFMDHGAVQCGFCTPGFVMSAVKLLEEYPEPTQDEIKQAITGNLCRCTGYYKIVQAIEAASKHSFGEKDN